MIASEITACNIIPLVQVHLGVGYTIVAGRYGDVAVELLQVRLQDLEVVKLAVAWAAVGGLLGDWQHRGVEGSAEREARRGSCAT
jgi:hypothetical protein